MAIFASIVKREIPLIANAFIPFVAALNHGGTGEGGINAVKNQKEMVAK